MSEVSDLEKYFLPFRLNFRALTRIDHESLIQVAWATEQPNNGFLQSGQRRDVPLDFLAGADAGQGEMLESEQKALRGGVRRLACRLTGIQTDQRTFSLAEFAAHLIFDQRQQPRG